MEHDRHGKHQPHSHCRFVAAPHWTAIGELYAAIHALRDREGSREELRSRHLPVAEPMDRAAVHRGECGVDMSDGINTVGAGIGSRDRLRRQRNMTAARNRIEPSRHVARGTFPHWSSTSGMCMCLLSCCLGNNGCKCKWCPCDVVGHPAYGRHSGKLNRQGEFNGAVDQARPHYYRAS